MALSNIEKKEKKEQEIKEQEKLEVMSDAIAKLYKNKTQYDNSKNTQRK